MRATLSLSTGVSVRAVAAAVVVALGLAVSPPSARAQIPFTEEAVARGIVGVNYYGMWTVPWGAGVALNDLDGDGDADCVLTVLELGGLMKILENVGGGFFVDRSANSVLPTGIVYCGVSAADYDGDADLDLYISGFNVPNELLRNDGGFVFTDVTQVAGVGDDGFTTGSCWGDYDGDGWLDLYMCNRTGSEALPDDTRPNRLYRNQGNGTFVELAAQHGVDDPWMSFQAQFFDHDLDSDLDLYVSNDKATGFGTNHNRLFRNDDGAFVDISDVSGAGVAIDSMGLDTGDFDGDLDFDIYVTNVPQGNKLLRNNNNGTYTEFSGPMGVEAFQAGWGCLFWDFDNDSWTDLYVANSYAYNNLFRHGGTFPATDVATIFGLHEAPYFPGIPGSGWCQAYADIDLDGDLDLLAQSWNEPIALFINHEGTQRNHLRVIPRQPGPNRFAVGATVEVKMGTVRRREMIRAGRGFKSSSELVAHFGLGSGTLVNQVLVRWPDGALSRVTNVAANQTITVDRALTQTLADCDRNFVPDFEQILATPSLDQNHDGVLDSCERLFRRGDANGDGLLDIADPIAVLAHLFSSARIPCRESADGNDDGLTDIADAVSILAHLFGGGNIPAPHGVCGLDPTPDPLDCDEDAGC